MLLSIAGLGWTDPLHSGRPDNLQGSEVNLTSVENEILTEESVPTAAAGNKPKYPGIPVTCSGNHLMAEHVETRITEGGIFYPITPSTEGEALSAGVCAGKAGCLGEPEDYHRALARGKTARKPPKSNPLGAILRRIACQSPGCFSLTGPRKLFTRRAGFCRDLLFHGYS